MAKGYQSERTGADVDRLLDKIDEFNPATKVDKVSGKQLSTEDFTTALKQKLQGLENYDDTEIINAIDRLRRDFDTLISGDTSEAIDTFNDIVAFLEGIEESENLDNIIAAIQLQIAGKQDKINDLDTIRAGAAKGATALQEHQDISHLATKEEVTQGLSKKVEKEHFGELNFALVDGLDNGSLAYALPDSANGDEDDVLLSRDSVKTVNGKPIYGKGNIYIPEYDDTHLDLRVSNLEQNKADKNGVYPEMSVGLAEDLGGRPFFEDAEFVFRASAGEDYSIKDGLATIKEIKGNSVVWNNMVDTRGYEAGFVIREGIKIRQGHRYLLQRSASNASMYLIPVVDGSESYDMVLRDGEYAKIFISQYTDTTDARVFAVEYCGACVITDLTKMFGAGNEPTTIEEFYARIPSGVDLNAYNAGEVIHMNTESIKSVGENLFNKEKAIRGYMENNQFIEAELSNRYGLLMRCIPNTEYYLKDAMNGYFIASAWFYDANMNYIDYDYVSNNTEVEVSSGIITTADNATYMVVLCHQDYLDLCMVSLVHSGWKQDVDAGYQPYWEDNLDLSVIGKYFPQGMKKAGSAYDEIRFNKASGKWEAVQRIGSVDMGTINWKEGDRDLFSNQLGYFTTLDDASFNENNILTSRYTIIPVGSTSKGIHKFTDKNFVVVDSAYTDTASFKAAMSGVILYYELAEPIITEIAEDIELIYDVADFGTEEAIASVPSTPFRARIMYDFNANDSIRNNSVTIRELKRIIAELTNRINSLESNQQ